MRIDWSDVLSEVMVVGEGFEPSKSMTADLQSAPFGRSGTPPGVIQIVMKLRDGGGGRIRTFEVDDGRFTVCSLWPLGNPTTGHCLVLLACSLTREAGRIISNDAPL